jgi:DNA topoisomerase VI subunit A
MIDMEEIQPEQPSLIQKLNERISLLDLVVGKIQNYHSEVHHQLKQTDVEMADAQVNDSTVFQGRQPHKRTLKTMLNFIKFLLQDEHTSLGVKNIELLWRLFVQQPIFTQDMTMFLTWINRNKQEHMAKTPRKQYYEMFLEEERKYLFLQILCPQVQ